MARPGHLGQFGLYSREIFKNVRKKYFARLLSENIKKLTNTAQTMIHSLWRRRAIWPAWLLLDEK